AVPAPIVRQQEGAKVGLISLGGCDGAVREAVDALRAEGIVVDYMRICGFPFDDDVDAFINAHEKNFVIEQNRDAQLKTLLIAETSVSKERLDSILVYGGFPLSSQHVVKGLKTKLGA
ncbi:MAG: 2-oxoacid:acceptor oxidoreductase subunit alpha, partial [Polyangiaceae bacterium]